MPPTSGLGSCSGLLPAWPYSSHVSVFSGLPPLLPSSAPKKSGVRKVLGASVLQIVFLLTKEFSRLVMISLVLAAPVGFIFARFWLQEFAYHSTIGPEIFVAAGLLALIIAWVTVGFQAIKAALSNPVDALRCE